MTDNAQVIALPTVPEKVNGIIDAVDWKDEASVQALLHSYAKTGVENDLDPEYLQAKSVFDTYRNTIIDVSTNVRDGVECYDRAAQKLTEVFLAELALVDAAERKPNGMRQAPRWKRIVELVLDGAGLKETDKATPGAAAERNKAREAINRRMFNILDLLAVTPTHPQAHLVQGWKRPGGGGTPSENTESIRFNYLEPIASLEKATKVVNEVDTRNTEQTMTRSKAEALLPQAEKLAAAVTRVVESCHAVINAAKAADATPAQGEAQAV